MTQQQKPRLKFFINKKFQTQFIFFILAPVLLSAVGMYVSKEMMYQDKIAFGEKLGLPADHGYFELLKRHQGIENQMMLISFIVMAVIFLAWGLYVSHRIAGPIHRFTDTLNSSSENQQVQPIHFRPNDFFQEIPDSFNRFLSTHGLGKKD